MRNRRGIWIGIGAICVQMCATSCSPSSDASPTATSETSVAPPPSASIDEGRILFSIESGEQETSVPAYIDAAGFHEIEMPADSTFAHAVWAPGGDVVFDSERAGPRHLFRMPVDGGEAVQVTDGQVNQMGAAMTPDGERVTFETWNDEHDLGFFTVDAADGGGAEPLFTRADAEPTGSGYLGFTGAAYSPNGRWIAFTMVTGRGGSASAVYVVRVDGSGLRRLTQDALLAASPDWSPDGKTILFHQNLFEHGGGGSPLWTVPFQGGKPQMLMGGYGPDQWASSGDWSPDGSQIVFQYFETGWDHNELRIVNADGTGEHTLWVTPTDAHGAEAPDWGP